MENTPDKPVNAEQTDDGLNFSWFANISVNVPIFFSVIGLVVAVIILDMKGCHSDAVYHDLYLVNKVDLVDSVLHKRMALLNAKKDVIQAAITPAPPRAGVKSKPLSTEELKVRTDSLNQLRAALSLSQKELDNIRHFNIDTSQRVFLNYFSVNRDVLRAILEGDENDSCLRFEKNIAVAIRDTFSLVNAAIPKTDSLKIAAESKRSGLLNFFGKYPNFGFWFFLSIAQMMMWFLLIPLIIGAVKKTRNIVPEFKYDLKNALFFSIIPLVIVGLFIGLLYFKLIGTYVIKDCFFLDGFNSRMEWYSIPGYFVAILFFGVYLFLANKLELLNGLMGAEDLSANEVLQTQYLSLRRTFDFAFLSTAIILSTFVLWIGVLFNSLNGIEVFRFYNLLSGKPFFDSNFVYLIGLMHSLILLIFYIPVRLQFNSLQITQQQKSMDEEDASGPKKAFKAFWGSLGTILITASPLITTVLEKAITSFIQ